MSNLSGSFFYILKLIRKCQLASQFFVKRRIDNIFLRRRIRIRGNNSSHIKESLTFCGLSECDVMYINLEHRVDRNAHMSEQFQSIGLSEARRIIAVKDQPGSLGCAKSHLLTYLSFEPSKYKLLMICEDDISFVASRFLIDKAINEFYHDERLDVLLLSYVSYNGVKISDSLSLTSDAQTTACYVLKPRALNDLIISAERSINLLSRGFPDKSAAIDVVWKDLQRKLWFAIVTDIQAVQIDSYSDIQKKVCSYFSETK